MTELSIALLAAKSSNYFHLKISEVSAKALRLHSVALGLPRAVPHREVSIPFPLC